MMLCRLAKPKYAKPGKDVTVIASSVMVHKSLAAAAALAGEGIDVEVIDLRTVSPLDVETITELVKKTYRAVVVQEAMKMAGTNAQAMAADRRARFQLAGSADQTGRRTGYDHSVQPTDGRFRPARRKQDHRRGERSDG